MFIEPILRGRLPAAPSRNQTTAAEMGKRKGENPRPPLGVPTPGHRAPHYPFLSLSLNNSSCCALSGGRRSPFVVGSSPFLGGYKTRAREREGEGERKQQTPLLWRKTLTSFLSFSRFLLSLSSLRACSLAFFLSNSAFRSAMIGRLGCPRRGREKRREKRSKFDNSAR